MTRTIEPSYALNAKTAYQQLKQNMVCSRNYLLQVRKQLADWFLLGADTEVLLDLYKRIIDDLLTHLWQAAWPEEVPIVLLAVGGYGRGQLFPHSDVDITFILADEVMAEEKYLHKIESMIATLWDSGLKIGHSVRSLSGTLQQAMGDQTILTNLLESRWLCGDKRILEKLQPQLYSLYPAEKYMQQKICEYQARHSRYALPPYALEPDIKSSPGGLRDVQLIEWLLNFTQKNSNISLSSLFTKNECEEWLSIKKYLNTVRFALHLQTEKTNERLIFDQQLQLATLFGEEGNNNQAVTHFMRVYWQHTRRVNLLVKRGLSLLQHPIIDENVPYKPNELFKIFADFSENKQADTLKVPTQRFIEKNLHLIPDPCSDNPQFQQEFLRILRSKKVTLTLRLLHDYQLLARYIPLVKVITGLMQYDLFHAYPVDQHTLLLVEQLENIIKGTHAELFPLGVTIAKKIDKPELLFLAGFFHDIGKGQTGHHEDIGADAMEQFCQQHHYSLEETQLAAWLVKNHLLLSYIAQQHDITNPATIEEFVKKVKDIHTLNHLYLLTIADIYATNTKLWTGWRSSLIDSLYQAAYQRLVNPSAHNNTDHVKEKQQSALLLMDSKTHETVTTLWKKFNPNYFLTYPAKQLAAHAQLLIDASSLPFINIHPHHSQNASEIFVYAAHHTELFFAITSILDQLQLSIVDAHIHTTDDQHNLSTFIVLQRGNKALDDKNHIDRVRKRLIEQLKNLDKITPPCLQLLPARLQTYPTIIEFDHDTHTENTILRLFTADRQGLLASIAQIFYQQGIQVLHAQINTLAERVEDSFWLLNNLNQPLSIETQRQLKQKLLEIICE